MTRFDDYFSIIYLNTHLSRDEAMEAARDAWNAGLTKYEALERAREIEEEKEDK